MSDDLHQNIIDNAPDFVFESRVDNFQFTKVNKRACKFYGYSKSEFMNMNIFDIEVSPPLKEQVKQLYDSTPIGDVLEVFGTNKKKDGSTFPVHVRFSKINKDFAIANVRDITEQRNNEKALRNAYIKVEKMTQKLQKANKNLDIRVKERTKSLRALASRLESIREEERSNISRQIHDELGHAITGIQFDLHALGKHPNLQKVEIIEKLDSITNQVHQSLEMLKRIASDLRPGVLDKLGLDAAIEWHLNQFQTRTKIKCKQNIKELPVEISIVKSTTVFRIFQEILTNIIRHSQAKEVVVTLEINQNNIELNVKDNGIGIPKDDIEGADSLGLLGMRERAIMTGGDFKIARMKKGGTEVNISIPV
ncbi:MAG: PAS domain-containing sensor histidine kinase [Bacteroidetes bacterium]|nr:PAS domain-containing sensor histidine kinase [Bacteroidota bacterium]